MNISLLIIALSLLACAPQKPAGTVAKKEAKTPVSSNGESQILVEMKTPESGTMDTSKNEGPTNEMMPSPGPMAGPLPMPSPTPSPMVSPMPSPGPSAPAMPTPMPMPAPMPSPMPQGEKQIKLQSSKITSAVSAAEPVKGEAVKFEVNLENVSASESTVKVDITLTPKSARSECQNAAVVEGKELTIASKGAASLTFEIPTFFPDSVTKGSYALNNGMKVLVSFKQKKDNLTYTAVLSEGLTLKGDKGLAYMLFENDFFPGGSNPGEIVKTAAAEKLIYKVANSNSTYAGPQADAAPFFNEINAAIGNSSGINAPDCLHGYDYLFFFVNFEQPGLVGWGSGAVGIGNRDGATPYDRIRDAMMRMSIIK